MRKSIIFTLFVILTNIATSQVITVSIDTAGYFEHSAFISTPSALESNDITYLSTFWFPESKVIVYDLNKRIQIFKGAVSPITKINKSSNTLDLEVVENGKTRLVVLGKSPNGGTMYIQEYIEDGMVKGFFSNNPETKKES
jgi:hypothetical protein